MSQAIIGISPAEIVASAAIPAYRLGSVGGYDHPTKGYQEFVYGRAATTVAVTGAGYVCLEGTGFEFWMANVTRSAPGQYGPGTRVVAAQAAMAAGDYGWFQVYGKGGVRVAAAAAKGTQLNTTSTGGQLDDDATAGAEVVEGLILLTTQGGAAGTNEDAVFSYPTVGRTL